MLVLLFYMEKFSEEERRMDEDGFLFINEWKWLCFVLLGLICFNVMSRDGIYFVEVLFGLWRVFNLRVVG